MNQIVVQLVFHPGTDIERVKAWIARVEATGALESEDVKEFSSDHGVYPSIYFP